MSRCNSIRTYRAKQSTNDTITGDTSGTSNNNGKKFFFCSLWNEWIAIVPRMRCHAFSHGLEKTNFILKNSSKHQFYSLICEYSNGFSCFFSLIDLSLSCRLISKKAVCSQSIRAKKIKSLHIHSVGNWINSVANVLCNNFLIESNTVWCVCVCVFPYLIGYRKRRNSNNRAQKEVIHILARTESVSIKQCPFS